MPRQGVGTPDDREKTPVVGGGETASDVDDSRWSKQVDPYKGLETGVHESSAKRVSSGHLQDPKEA
ncbi:hypothetical protein MN0502_33810 (plasmid) [Arthrobacter sp. MN05-02]|nr:hypothetical protein MN0502_33810 [Arthrobacter sp. MN05-02]